MKIIYILLIGLYLCAQENIEPKWILHDPDNKGIYFRGYSSWYVTENARMEALAQKDAVSNAYASVSDYFGIKIDSSLQIEKTLTNTRTNVKIHSKVKTQTSQLIFNLKPLKKYVQFNQDKSNFRVHILILLDKATEQSIKSVMKKDEDEFKALMGKVQLHIEQKKYLQAQNILELAKGKRAALFDDSVNRQEKRLKELMKGILNARLQINKKMYLPDEEIHLEASLNQKGYMYIFCETSSDIEMIFPNIYQRNAYIKKEELISFPSEDISLIAYEEDLEKSVRFFVIASKKNLGLKPLAQEEIDGIYLYNKEGEFLNLIDKCIEEGGCSKGVTAFNISNKLDVNAIEIQYLMQEDIATTMQKYFRENGVKIGKSTKKIVYSIGKETRYSKALDTVLVVYTIEAKLYEKDILLKTVSEESSYSGISETSYEMYQRLVLK